jgi:hypothetical protein
MPHRERESSVESFFRRRVQLLGGYTFKLAPTEAGVADRLVVMPGGRMYLVELKTEDGTVSPIQEVWHRKIRRVGGKVHTLYGRGQILNWLRIVTSADDPAKRVRAEQQSA